MTRCEPVTLSTTRARSFTDYINTALILFELIFSFRTENESDINKKRNGTQHVMQIQLFNVYNITSNNNTFQHYCMHILVFSLFISHISETCMDNE